MTEKDAAALGDDADKFDFEVIRYVVSCNDISRKMELTQSLPAAPCRSTANWFRDTEASRTHSIAPRPSVILPNVAKHF